MKRLIVLLSIVLLLTGCSFKVLNNNNLSYNMKYLLNEKVKLYNVYFEGYKYYLPKGMRSIHKDDYNAVLKDKDNNKYYLYVDAISYYHKVKNSYEVNEKSHYSKVLNYNKNTGYIQIDEVDSKYFVQMVFNYVKLEAYVLPKDLTSVVDNMCIISRSVKFNDKVLESLIGENILDYKEEEYSLFKPDSTKENFLDVVEREETDKYKKDIEDEKIELDD